MITYNLAPIPMWVLRDNNGAPLANGYMKAFRDVNRSMFKAVYQDMGGITAWVQPIVFNAAGFQGPFYWASDENYYLEIYDSSNTLVRTVPDYNAPVTGGGTIVSNTGLTNLINDSQFNFPAALTFSPLLTTQQLGTSNWIFVKNNATATDRIDFIPFLAGSVLPPFNPTNYISFQCTVPGTLETFKDINFQFNNVETLQGNVISISFWAQSTTLANQLQIYAIQYFGTGGSPSPNVDTPLGTLTLTPTWTQYQLPAVVIPSILGTILGTNNDSYLRIAFRMQNDVITTINFTNVQLNVGSIVQPFDYLPLENTTPLQIPPFNSVAASNSFPYININGNMAWAPYNDVFLTCTSGAFNLTVAPQIIPFGFAGGYPSNWISSGVIIPKSPCRIMATAWLQINSPSGADNVTVFAQLNGSFQFLANTLAISSAGVYQMTFPIMTTINGTGDFIQILAYNTGVLTSIQMEYMTITIIL